MLPSHKVHPVLICFKTNAGSVSWVTFRKPIGNCFVFTTSPHATSAVHMGVGRGAKDPWILKFDILLQYAFLAKKGYFLSFERVKCNVTIFRPPWKIPRLPLEKSTIVTPGKKSFRRPWLYTLWRNNCSFENWSTEAVALECFSFFLPVEQRHPHSFSKLIILLSLNSQNWTSLR